jgi:hypothetical protein
MTTYIVDGGGEATLPPGPLTLTLSASRPSAQVRVEWVQGDESTRSHVVAPRPGLLILPDLHRRGVVRVRPQSGESFPAGTTVGLTATTSRPGDADADRATLTDVDVSGLGWKDLVALTPGPGGVTVTGLGSAVEEALSPLASAARVSARRAIGVDRLREDSLVDVLVGLEPSVSAGRHLGDGAVDALMEVFTGLARVVARRQPQVVALGEGAEIPLEGPDVEAAAALLVRSGAWTRTFGARVRVPTSGGRADARLVSFVVGDGPPLPLGTGPEPARVHRVVLAPRTAWDVLRSMSPQPVTFVPLVSGPAPTAVLSRPDVLGELVLSLVSACTSRPDLGGGPVL